MRANPQRTFARALEHAGCNVSLTDLPSELNMKIHEHLNGIWNAAPRTRHCVAPSPVDLTRKRLFWLRKEMYMVAAKTDGTRMLLLFVALPDPTIIAYNRRREFVQIRGSAPADFFRQRGTLLDGELLRDGRFLIFDAVYSRGCSYMQRNYVDRLLEASSLATDLALDIPGLSLRVKRVYNLKDISHLIRDMEKDAGVPNDGVLMTPVNCGISPGTNDMMFKLKSVVTVDLMVDRSSASALRLLWKGASGLGAVHTQNKYGLFLEPSEMPDDCEGVQEFSVCLEPGGHSLSLRWLRSRGDEKTSPNFHTVVLDIFDAACENITLTEVALMMETVEEAVTVRTMPTQMIRERSISTLGEEKVPPKKTAYSKVPKQPCLHQQLLKADRNASIQTLRMEVDDGSNPQIPRPISKKQQADSSASTSSINEESNPKANEAFRPGDAEPIDSRMTLSLSSVETLTREGNFKIYRPNYAFKKRFKIGLEKGGSDLPSLPIIFSGMDKLVQDEVDFESARRNNKRIKKPKGRIKSVSESKKD
jgi:mRNA capping enzyme, catalytic domain